MSDVATKIATFLADGPFAVVGASADREKYGNKVFRAYLQRGLHAYPIHPKLEEIEGRRAYHSLTELPEAVRAISVITSPSITEKIVEQAAAAGVRRIWMQPGAESAEAVRRAEELGLEVIAGGPCLLVAVGFRES